MKKHLFCLILFLLSASLCIAADPVTGKGLTVPVEFRAGTVLIGIGKLEYTGDSLEIVEFIAGASGRVLVTPRIFGVRLDYMTLAL